MGQGRGLSLQPRLQILAEETVDSRQVDRAFPTRNSWNASVLTLPGPWDTLLAHQWGENIHFQSWEGMLKGLMYLQLIGLGQLEYKLLGNTDEQTKLGF